MTKASYLRKRGDEMKLENDEIECPKCGSVARADFVDIGVGMQQCGPYGCEKCGWVEDTVDPVDGGDSVKT